MKREKQFTSRILSLALALVMVLGMVPHLSLEAHAAISETLTVDGLTYTITVQSATDKNGNNKMGEIEGILLYSTPSRSGSKVSFQAYMIGYMSLATYSFTETSCTEKLTATTSNQMGNGNKVVLSITRSAASHTGGTCTSPTCSRCQRPTMRPTTTSGRMTEPTTGRNAPVMHLTKQATALVPAARLTVKRRQSVVLVRILMAAQTLTIISGGLGVMLGQRETAENAPCVGRRRNTEIMFI